MQVTLRLSYPEDVDLILMRFCEKRDFCARVKECILSYAEGRNYIYTFPDINKDVIASLPQKDKVNLVISEKRNPEIISFLAKYNVSLRKHLVKSLLRASFKEYPSEPVLMALGITSLAGTQEYEGKEPDTVQETSKPVLDVKKPAPAKRVAPQEASDEIPSLEKEKIQASPQNPVAQKENSILEASQISGTMPEEKPLDPESHHMEQGHLADNEKERNLFEMFLNM